MSLSVRCSVVWLLLVGDLLLPSVPGPLVNFGSSQLESGSKRSDARRAEVGVAHVLSLEKRDLFSCEASSTYVLF